MRLLFTVFIIGLISACSHLPNQSGTLFTLSSSEGSDSSSQGSDSAPNKQVEPKAHHSNQLKHGAPALDHTGQAPQVAKNQPTLQRKAETSERHDWLTKLWPWPNINVQELSGEHTQTTEQVAEGQILWQRIRDGFALNLSTENPRIAQQLKWYLRHPTYLERTFARASRYLYYIVEVLETHDMPLEIALLPLVESAFDPFAYSHGRAAGLWQFIPGTGKAYGMPQNWWYDGRRDVLASTEGAARYLTSLNKRFKGDWLHALASYNTGGGRVSSAIRYNRKRNKGTSFWDLKLPKETRAYVPKLIAIAKIVAEPERYQVKLPDIANAPVFEAVTLDSQIDLAQAAKLAAIDIQELYRLNPGFNQWATPPQGPHRLLLPIKSVVRFKEKFSALPKRARISWQRYSVKSGDSLIKIAKQFNTTPALIRELNRLKGNTIRVKQKLLIPMASKQSAFYNLSANNRLSRKQQKIKAPRNTAKLTHTVKAGDTLWELAIKHKVGTRSIAKWNGMAPGDVLKPGQKLLIYSKASTNRATKSSQYQLPDRRQMIKRVYYQVRKGDSLARIASKFGVRVNNLVKWNKLNKKKYLQPGQKLKIYVDITRA